MVQQYRNVGEMRPKGLHDQLPRGVIVSHRSVTSPSVLLLPVLTLMRYRTMAPCGERAVSPHSRCTITAGLVVGLF